MNNYGSMCEYCGQWVGTAIHNCWSQVQYYRQSLVPMTVKPCGVCGSTAIFHTDAQCERNQRPPTPTITKAKGKK